MADATASPKWCTAKLRRKNPAGDSQALAPPGKTESRNSWLRSRRSTIEPMNRASASAPSGPAASDPGEASIGNLSSRARLVAPLLDSLIAPSATDGRHFAHTIPPRDTTKYTVVGAPLLPLEVAQTRQRVNSSPKPAHPSSRI